MYSLECQLYCSIFFLWLRRYNILFLGCCMGIYHKHYNQSGVSIHKIILDHFLLFLIKKIYDADLCKSCLINSVCAHNKTGVILNSLSDGTIFKKHFHLKFFYRYKNAKKRFFGKKLYFLHSNLKINFIM